MYVSGIMEHVQLDGVDRGARTMIQDGSISATSGFGGYSNETKADPPGLVRYMACGSSSSVTTEQTNVPNIEQ